MVQMRVCEKYMVDGLHFVQRKVATPVPASIRMLPSIRNEVVRQSRAIAPEQPSTRTFMVITAFILFQIIRV